MSKHENEVPGRIKVMNPFSGEYEEGELRDDGVFIGDGVELDLPSDNYNIERRAILLGRSSVKDHSRIGSGSIINGVHLSYADIGRDVIVGEGSLLTGSTSGRRAIVDDEARIGGGCFIDGASYIGRNAKIGDNVNIDNAFVGDNCVVESGSDKDFTESLELGQMTTKRRTTISNANIGANSTIGADTVIAKIDIPEGSVIGPESRIRSSRRAPSFWS